MPRLNAWPFRDWVVRALNRDLPYDEFVRLQLAADLLPNTPPADYPALGFLGLFLVIERVWPAQEYTRLILESGSAVPHQMLLVKNPAGFDAAASSLADLDAANRTPYAACLTGGRRTS